MTSTAGTEDETFNILRRTPIKDIDSEYWIRRWEFYSNDSLFQEWLDKHGWNKEEFHMAGNEYERERRRIHRG